MRFRVTSITYEEEGRLISAPMCKIEDWLNAALGDGQFGGSLDSLMLLVISYYVNEAGERNRTPKKSQLSTYRDQFSGEVQKVLALHIPVEDKVLLSAGPEKILRVLSRLIIENLPDKPTRMPKGLEYDRLRNGLEQCLEVFASSEA